MRMFIVFVVFMEWFQWVHGALLSEVTSTIKSQLTLNNMFAFAEEESESIIFGYGISGFVDSQTRVNSNMYIYSPRSGVQNVPLLTSSSNSFPPARANSVSAYYNKTLILGLGNGVDINVYFTDMWSLDIRSLIWTRVDPEYCRTVLSSSVCPLGRNRAAAIYITSGKYANNILIHGGYASSPIVALSDFWLFDLVSLTWSQIFPTENFARYGHGSVLYKDRIFFFGGFITNSSNVANLTKLFSLDLKSLYLNYTDISGIIQAQSGPSPCSTGYVSGCCNYLTSPLYLGSMLLMCSDNPMLYYINLDSSSGGSFGSTIIPRRSGSSVILNNRIYLLGDSRNTFSISSAILTGNSSMSMNTSTFSLTFFPNSAATTDVSFSSGHAFGFLYDKILLFGGSSKFNPKFGIPNPSSSVAFVLDYRASIGWRNVSFVGDFSSLYLPAALSFNNSIFVYGGMKGPIVSSDLFQLTTTPISSDLVFKWSNLSQILLGQKLPALFGASLNVVSISSKSFLIIYGGSQSFRGIPESAIFCVSLDLMTVFSITASTNISMMLHGAISYNNRLIFYNGFNTTFSVYTLDVFADDGISFLGTWSLQDTQGSTSELSSREGYSVTSFNTTFMIIYGGTSTISGVFYGNIWILDCTTFVFGLISATNLPSSRAYAAISILDYRIFISGGIYDSAGSVNSVSLFVVAPISQIGISAEKGSNYNCLAYPSKYACISLDYAYFVYSPFSGFVQSFIIHNNFLGSLTMQSLVISSPISIDVSDPRQTVTFDCSGASCFTIVVPLIYVTVYPLVFQKLNQLVTFRNLNFVNAIGGIGFVRSGHVSFESCTFSNSTSSQGGALFIDYLAYVVIQNCGFYDLTSSQSGGAVFGTFLGGITFRSCVFKKNKALSRSEEGYSIGGGALAFLSVDPVIISSCVFVDNFVVGTVAFPSYGGAIFGILSKLVLTNCSFISNYADNGGALSSVGIQDLFDSTVSIDGSSVVSVYSSSFLGNIANLNGGAFFHRYGLSSVFDSCIFSSNKALRGGGAMYLYSAGTFTAFLLSFDSNSAQREHGGAVCCIVSSIVFNETSFTMNEAPYGGGGAIYWTRANDLETQFVPDLIGVKFTNNTAAFGNSLASNGMRLVLSYVVNSVVYKFDDKYPVQQAGTVVDTLLVHVVDYYFSVVVTDYASKLLAAPATSWSGANVISVFKGVGIFSQLVFSRPANSTSEFFVVSPTVYNNGTLISDSVHISSAACVAGKFSAAFGCSSCPPGKFSDTSMALFCLDCIPGYISIKGGNSSCFSCNKGTYANTHGGTVCLDCGDGLISYYSASSSCSSCPVNSKSVSGSTCVCLNGFYSTSSVNTSNNYVNFFCKTCPSGANCSVSGLSFDSVLVLPGFFPALNTPVSTVELMSCFNPAACVGFSTIVESSLLCGLSYTGPLCSVCKPNYQYLLPFECVVCPPSNLEVLRITGISVCGVLFYFVYARILRIINKHPSTQEGLIEKFENSQDESSLPSAIVQICISVTQFNAIAHTISIDWPYPLNDFLSIQQKGTYFLSTILSIQCIAPSLSSLSFYYQQTLMFVLLPILLFLGVSLCYFFVFVYYYLTKKLSNLENTSWLMDVISVTYILCFFNLPNIAQQAFSIFVCYKVGNSSSDYFLMADMSQQCWTSSHFFWCIGVAIPILVVYVFGIPFSAFIVLYRNSHDFNQKEISGMAFLHSSFQPKYWFWWIILYSRSLLLIIIAVFDTDVAEQTLTAILLSVFVFVIHVYFQPYGHRTLNLLELYGLFSSFCTYFLGALIRIQDPLEQKVLAYVIFVNNFLFICIFIILWIYYKRKLALNPPKFVIEFATSPVSSKSVTEAPFTRSPTFSKQSLEVSQKSAKSILLGMHS